MEIQDSNAQNTVMANALVGTNGATLLLATAAKSSKERLPREKQSTRSFVLINLTGTRRDASAPITLSDASATSLANAPSTMIVIASTAAVTSSWLKTTTVETT